MRIIALSLQSSHSVQSLCDFHCCKFIVELGNWDPWVGQINDTIHDKLMFLLNEVLTFDKLKRGGEGRRKKKTDNLYNLAKIAVR